LNRTFSKTGWNDFVEWVKEDRKVAQRIEKGNHMRHKQSVTLYNLLFPIWILVWLPSPLWLLLIPLNFIIDYLVLYKSLPASSERKTFCNRHAWKICAAGFAADFIGSLFLFVLFRLTGEYKSGYLKTVSQALAFNPFANAGALLIIVLAILLAAYCIYRLDLHILKRAGLTEGQSKTSALWLAAVTAPYLFLLPSEILYR